MSNQNILILGTARFAPVVLDIISETPGYTVCGFIENMDRSRCGDTINGQSIYWIDDTADLTESHQVICCLGTTKRSRIIQEAEAIGFSFATIVHPMSRIPSTSSVAKGCLIGPGVMISTNTHLSAHVRINRGALIGHDVTIGEYATIQPGANIASSCQIDKKAYLGMSCTVLENVHIGESSVVGAGAVVTKDVPSRSMVVGIPAKVVKEKINDF